MERPKTQTHDFLNLKSFSRLSFSPHFPPKENSIRLFGKEFGSADLATLIHKETKENAENRRKYECNYCCRNFSTSQALGGHQNAHRKERLLAKRPQIQSLSIHHRSSSKTQLHNFVNHHHHNLKTTSSQPCHQQSATNNVSSNSNYVRGCGWKTSYTSHKTPINGRPLALWRFPTAVLNSTSFKHGGLLSSSNTGSSSRNLYVHESQPNIRDQVSLDLHL